MAIQWPVNAVNGINTSLCSILQWSHVKNCRRVKWRTVGNVLVVLELEFQPITAYFIPLKHKLASSSLIQHMPNTPSLFRPILAYSSLIQPLSAYYSHLEHSPAYSSTFQSKSAYSSIFSPI